MHMAKLPLAQLLVFLMLLVLVKLWTRGQYTVSGSRFPFKIILLIFNIANLAT